MFVIIGAMVAIAGVAAFLPAPSSAPAAKPAPGAWTYAAPNYATAPKVTSEADLPPWQRNTNIFFGGDPTLAASGDFGEFFSSIDPSTPGGRSNLGLFGWSDNLFSVATGHPEDAPSLLKSVLGLLG